MVDKDGATPLMFAAMRGHAEVHKRVGLMAVSSSDCNNRYAERWSMEAVKLMHRIIAVAGLHSCKPSITGGCG